MAYVVVNRKTRTAISRTNGMVAYETEAAARAGRTRLLASGRFPDDLEVMGFEAYHRQIPQVEVTNLMSGDKVTIRADQLGGPCDPSTERYWSM